MVIDSFNRLGFTDAEVKEFVRGLESGRGEKQINDYGPLRADVQADSHGAWWRGCQGGPSADDEEELGKEDTEDTPSSICKDLKGRHGEQGWV